MYIESTTNGSDGAGRSHQRATHSESQKPRSPCGMNRPQNQKVRPPSAEETHVTITVNEKVLSGKSTIAACSTYSQ